MAKIIIEIDTSIEQDVLDLAETFRHVLGLVTHQSIVRSTMSDVTPFEAAERTVWENYGPESSPEVFGEAEALAMFGNGDVNTETLLAAALVVGLDADGILAMLRGAAQKVA